MLVNSTEVQNNFGKYLDLAEQEEIIITKNGKPAARLVGVAQVHKFLADSLYGIIPKDVDEKALKSERLSQK
jgi:prevent-host-death family protein